MADTYITILSKIVLSMEASYGFHRKDSSGQAVADKDLKDVLEFVKEELKGSSKEEIAKRNKEVAKDVILLSYVTKRIRYYDYYKLNYKKYPAIKEVARVLLNFTTAKRNTTESRKQLNKIIRLLEELDKKEVTIRVGLAYKYLRIFIVMVLYGNLCNASIVADFIISQFVVKRK